MISLDDADPFGQPSLVHSLLHDAVLLRHQPVIDYLGAIFLSGEHRHATPAGTHLHQPVPWLECQLTANVVTSLVLRLGQRRRAFGPIALGVQTVVAEHQPEELERQPIVMYRVGLSSREVLIVVAPLEISAFGQQQRIGSVMISSCERHPYETAYGAFPLDVDITIEVGFEE